MRHEVHEVQAADRLVPAPERPRNGTVRVLMIGDVIGRPGREGVERLLPGLRAERSLDFVTANGENVAGGMGLTASTARGALRRSASTSSRAGTTSGTSARSTRSSSARNGSCVRSITGTRVSRAGAGASSTPPTAARSPSSTPRVAPTCSRSRTRSPTVRQLLEEGADELPAVRIVDFHCEITSEKNAFGLHLDGLVSAVCGTHTHVVTGDERILPRGTAYLTDIGMTGPVYSVIGFEPRTVLPRFLNGLPTRFEVGSGPVVFNAVQIDIDTATGRALHVERVSRMVES